MCWKWSPFQGSGSQPGGTYQPERGTRQRPLSGGTGSVLIRCMRAQAQYLVSPQMRLENQAAAAASAAPLPVFGDFAFGIPSWIRWSVPKCDADFLGCTKPQGELESVSRLCLWVLFGEPRLCQHCLYLRVSSKLNLTQIILSALDHHTGQLTKNSHRLITHTALSTT